MGLLCLPPASLRADSEEPASISPAMFRFLSGMGRDDAGADVDSPLGFAVVSLCLYEASPRRVGGSLSWTGIIQISHRAAFGFDPSAEGQMEARRRVCLDGVHAGSRIAHRRGTSGSDWLCELAGRYDAAPKLFPLWYSCFLNAQSPRLLPCYFVASAFGICRKRCGCAGFSSSDRLCGLAVASPRAWGGAIV